MRDQRQDERDAAESESLPPRHMRRESKPKPTLVVGNLFFDVTAEDLQKLMEQYGTVQHVKLIHDNRGLSKGWVDGSLSLSPSVILRLMLV